MHPGPRRSVLARRIAVAAVASLLGGCIPYPIYKTLEPAIVVVVNDAAAQPIAGATVTLISSAYPYGRERSRSDQPTDALGRAAFAGRQEWRAESFFIHGAEEYFWNLCVRHPGFATYETRHRSSRDFDPRSPVVLQTGTATPCHKPS